jgi:cyclic pyranopterin phosphate synthase
VRKLSLSTNGYRLVELAADLERVGVTAFNVSVDSLDRSRFHQITGHDKLPAVLAGVERCLELGLETKVNAVLMKELNDGELDRFFDWTRKTPIGVRFIELMPTADNIPFFTRRHFTSDKLIEKLLSQGWREEPRKEGDGPAKKFRRKGHLGSIGVIAPYSKDFCASCNRLRVTSRGELRLCLFAEQDASLRDLLRHDEQLGELQARIRALVNRKEVSHYLPEGRLGNTKNFAVMGG